MPQGYVDQGFRKKPTYSEILSSIERDEDKIQLPERTALTFWDSFAMGQYKEMLETAAVGQQGQAERVQLDASMTQADRRRIESARAGWLHARHEYPEHSCS